MDQLTHTCCSVKRFEHAREVKQLQKIEQLDNRIKELEAELDRFQTNTESLRLKEGQQNEQLHNRIKELEAELTQRADEVLKEQLRVIVCLVSFPAAACPPTSARARPWNPRRIAGGARTRQTVRAPKTVRL